MSSLIVAAILIAFVAVCCLLFVFISNKHKNKAMSDLLNKISEVGTENKLSFSSHEILKDSIIGADGIQRKILFVKKLNFEIYQDYLIDLEEVKSCSVKKVYGSIKAGKKNEKSLEQYLENIFLHFEFNNKDPFDISFYDHTENNIYQLKEMEFKAKHWERILSKMLKASTKKIA